MPLDFPLGRRLTEFENELERSPEYQKFLWQRAEEAAAVARGLALAEGLYDTGDYHDSIHVRMGENGVELAADDHKSFWIEFGTVAHDIENAFGRGFTVRHPGTSPRYILQRAVRAAGMDLDDPGADRNPRPKARVAFDARLKGSQFRDPSTGRIARRPGL